MSPVDDELYRRLKVGWPPLCAGPVQVDPPGVHRSGPAARPEAVDTLVVLVSRLLEKRRLR
jgi:hypothetical protein